MSTTEKTAPVYLSGLAARAQGYPLSVNPNCLGSAAHARWAAQWHKENDRLAVRPPQDIPFWPDYLNRELGGPRRWVIAQRLTPRLERDGHEIAIHPKKYAAMEAAHAAEVRTAVRLQMVALVGEEAADALLELPGLRIETDGQRDWPGSELERRHAERAAEHAAQVAARESFNREGVTGK